MNKQIKTGLVVFVLMLIYAYIRYNYFSNVPIRNFPVYITNKSFAFTALILYGMAYLIGPLQGFGWIDNKAPFAAKRNYGLMAAIFGLTHVLLVSINFTTERYGKFFYEDGNLNLYGELSLLAGVLVFIVLVVLSIHSFPRILDSVNKLSAPMLSIIGRIGLYLGFLHVYFMGVKGWLTPEKWPGMLPPISLLAGLFILIVLLFRLISLLIGLFTKQKIK